MDETTICNMALGHVGADPISNLTTSRSKNAEYCNTFFETARDATLEGHDWNFARVRRSLAAASEEAPEDWSYAYSYPSDCIKFRKMLHNNRRTNNPYPFEVALKEDKSSMWILTDLSPATGVYTARVSNISLFSPLAVEAMALKLASLIVVPITRKLDAPVTYQRLFMQKLSEAEASSSNEVEMDEPPESTFVEARY